MSLSHAAITVTDPNRSNEVVGVYNYTRNLENATAAIIDDIIQGEYDIHENATPEEIHAMAEEIALENYGQDCYDRAHKDYAADHNLTDEQAQDFEYTLFDAVEPKEI